MKTNLHTNICTLALLALLPAAHAQTQTTAFTYQGRLNDSGAPANGSYDFQFALFDAVTNGNQLTPFVTNSAVSVSNGLFTTAIDFGAAFDGSDRWLSIAVGTNGAAHYVLLRPRQPVTPVPYALAALSVNGLTIQSDNTNGAPNVISGSPVNYVSSGIIGATIAGGGITNYPGTSGFAFSNTVTANFGTVSGGLGNLASGLDASVGGGEENVASNQAATVSGGSGNTAGGGWATIGGGSGNFASGDHTTIGGGWQNAAIGQYAMVGGGYENSASGPGAFIGGGGTDDHSFGGNIAEGGASVVVGGIANVAVGAQAFVGGGLGNVAYGNQAAVPGGADNTANGDFSFAAGYSAQALHDGAFVWADSQGADFASTGANQFLIRAAGGVGIGTASPGAKLHVHGNADPGTNVPSSTAILASGDYLHNRIMAADGDNVLYLSMFSTNYGELSTYNYDTAAGLPLVLNENGGNVGIGIDAPAYKLDVNGSINARGTVYANGVALTSDRNAKENFAPVNPQTVLDKVASLPVTEWNYKSDDAQQKHIGPMAQDFHAAFGLNGADDRHISVIDEGGVALAAIQGLSEKLNAKDAEIRDLKKRLDDLEQIVRAQKTN